MCIVSRMEFFLRALLWHLETSFKLWRNRCHTYKLWFAFPFIVTRRGVVGRAFLLLGLAVPPGRGLEPVPVALHRGLLGPPARADSGGYWRRNLVTYVTLANTSGSFRARHANESALMSPFEMAGQLKTSKLLNKLHTVRKLHAQCPNSRPPFTCSCLPRRIIHRWLY